MQQSDNAMKPDKADFSVRSKIWIEDTGGKVIFGLGRYRILDAIRRQGSIRLRKSSLTAAPSRPSPLTGGKAP